MPARDKLLELLERGKGAYFSGEELARELSISRAAVWKAVSALREAGYAIDAAPNRGYCLSRESDILSRQGISKYLNARCAGLQIEVLPTLGSTNAAARERAEAGAAEGLTIISNEQTAGRGRRGRSFYSPGGAGVYMSVLLRPKEWSFERSGALTASAAVAACESIEAVSGERAGVKWVNDVYIGEKKVCGILTEAVFGLEGGVMEYAVVGVGINAYPSRAGFPPELEPIAGTVLPASQPDAKTRLAAAFLNRFMAYYAAPDPAECMQKYRARSLAVGRRVTVLSGGKAVQAQALDIDAHCRLLVRYDDGTQAKLSSGEISIHFGGGA